MPFFADFYIFAVKKLFLCIGIEKFEKYLTAILSYFLIICLILNYIAHIGLSICPSLGHVSDHKYEPSKAVV